MYFHALELFLKAYLRSATRYSDEALRQEFGHDLVALLTEAEEHGLPKRESILRVCEQAGAFDQPMDARYIKTGAKRKVLLRHLFEAARDLQALVREALKKNGVRMRALSALPHVHREPPSLTMAQAVKLLARRYA